MKAYQLIYEEVWDEYDGDGCSYETSNILSGDIYLSKDKAEAVAKDKSKWPEEGSRFSSTITACRVIEINIIE